MLLVVLTSLATHIIMTKAKIQYTTMSLAIGTIKKNCQQLISE